jgi:uncharacterized radical SAM superfamily protein
MQAGREVDVLIAEKVMGMPTRGWADYSTDIEEALTVIEKMRDRFGAEFLLTCNVLGEWRAAFTKPNMSRPPMVADTAPLAICLAALAAVAG